MPLLLDDMRHEFARFLTEDPAGRFRMDAALAHVVTLAYNQGLAEGAQDQLAKARASDSEALRKMLLLDDNALRERIELIVSFDKES